MKNAFVSRSMGEGMELCSVSTSRFKTGEITINLAMPLKKETAAAQAIVPYLLSRSCAAYPDLTRLNRKLAYLYGAALSAGVTKQGESQVLRLGIDCVDDRFSLTEESICAQCAALLCELLFHPDLEKGCFKEEAVEMEKRLLAERIESEESEKRVYALQRLEEEMCRGEDYGVSRFGTVEQVRALTGEEVFRAWQKILQTAQVQVNVVGNTQVDPIAQMISEAFAKAGRQQPVALATQRIPRAQTVRTVQERLPVSQGKLVLGFRLDVDPEGEEAYAAKLMSDVFGGGPYSRLFMNVREKLSLCYYCNARYIRKKALLVVQCGCEEENMQKAIDEILVQLKIVQDNQFEEKDFSASKLGTVDALLSINDMPEDLENWYLSQLGGPMVTPEEYAENITRVTREQVALAARKATLDTIYQLMPEQGGESHEN